jgi:protein SCO1/2
MFPSRPLIATLAALVLVLAGCSGSGGGTGLTVLGDGSGNPGGLRGVVPSEHTVKPALNLTDADGRPFDLRARTQGKVTLLFFGYTYCPDVCPTTMADIAAALDEVDPTVRDRVAVVFVSTDPDRDTGPVLARWLRQFDARFIGVRGPLARVKTQAEALGIPLMDPQRQADGSYTITHGTQVIAFTRDNRARVVYLAGTQVKDYLHDLPLLTAEAA